MLKPGQLSPLVAANLICRECGTVMKPKAVMARFEQRQIVHHLEYVCKNPKTGCNYKIDSTAMTSAEMIGLREDGSEVRIGE